MSSFSFNRSAALQILGKKACQCWVCKCRQVKRQNARSPYRVNSSQLRSGGKTRTLAQEEITKVEVDIGDARVEARSQCSLYRWGGLVSQCVSMFRRLFLGSIDASDSESRIIFRIFRELHSYLNCIFR